MNKNRIRGLRWRASEQLIAKPISIKLTGGKSGDCASCGIFLGAAVFGPAAPLGSPQSVAVAKQAVLEGNSSQKDHRQPPSLISSLGGYDGYDRAIV